MRSNVKMIILLKFDSALALSSTFAKMPVWFLIRSIPEIADREAKIYQLAKNTCCQTENIIYALFCSTCQKIYIGETKRPFIHHQMEGTQGRHSPQTWHPCHLTHQQHLQNHKLHPDRSMYSLENLRKPHKNSCTTENTGKMVDTHLTNLPTLRFHWIGLDDTHPSGHISHPTHRWLSARLQ